MRTTSKRGFMLLLAVALLAGCHRAATTGSTGLASSSSRQTLTLIAIDNSGSTDSMRKELVTTAYDVATELKKDADAFKAYVFAGDIREFASEVPTDEDAFGKALADEALPTSTDHGTDYSKVLERLADVSASSPEHSIRLIVAGDGFTDINTPSVIARFERAGKQLAANPRISMVICYGIKPGAREQLERYLKGGSYQLRFIDLGQDLPPLS